MGRGTVEGQGRDSGVAQSLRQSGGTSGSTAPSQPPAPASPFSPGNPSSRPGLCGQERDPEVDRSIPALLKHGSGVWYLRQSTLPPSRPRGRAGRREAAGRGPQSAFAVQLHPPQGRRPVATLELARPGRGAQEARAAGLGSVRALAAVPGSAQGRPAAPGVAAGRGAGAGGLSKTQGPPSTARATWGRRRQGAPSPRPGREPAPQGCCRGILSRLCCSWCSGNVT